MCRYIVYAFQRTLKIISYVKSIQHCAVLIIKQDMYEYSGCANSACFMSTFYCVDYLLVSQRERGRPHCLQWNNDCMEITVIFDFLLGYGRLLWGTHPFHPVFILLDKSIKLRHGSAQTKAVWSLYVNAQRNHLAKVWTRNPKNEFAFFHVARYTPSPLQSKSERESWMIVSLSSCILNIIYV